ncbi:pentatricopeptide repeat-containing protein, partial [Trifolium medium]|nr:pentatricopeptide repeat-containing protein [Trifolium medium]
MSSPTSSASSPHSLVSPFIPTLTFSSHSNTIIDMYVKCGLLQSARKVFDEMPHRDAVSWTELIVA